MILEVIKKNKLLTILLLISIIGAIVSVLLPPLVLEEIVDRLTDKKTISFLLVFSYFLTTVISCLFDSAKEVLITIFGQKTTRHLRSVMCKKLSFLPASYYVKNQSGVTVSRFVNDVDTMESLLASGIIGMFVDACKVVSIIGVIFIKSLGLGILMLLVAPILLWITRQFQKRMLQAQLKNRIAVGKVNNHVPETIYNIRMIHTFHKENYMEEKYDHYITDSYGAMEKTNLYDSIYSPLILIIRASIIAIMMVLSAMGGRMQAFFGMSVGTAIAIIAYVAKVFSPLESIGMEIQNIQSALAGAKRIREFLKEEERVMPTKTVKNLGKDAIVLQDVSFSYDGNTSVLENLSFTIQKGENVTLTGRTGAGKSTIFKLLLGLYAPNSGSVKIFGVEAKDINDLDKRELFGYVEQGFHMIPGSIAKQISLYDEKISMENIQEAAKLVGLHETIMSFEKGYDTPCTPQLFSQGQIQLLAIARAIVADPKILLLDEITANLDSDTEHKVLEALQKASKNRTVLSISHRLYEKTGGRMIKI